jgi:shikimate kinase
MPNEPSRDDRPCRILLVGMMGSGKSTVGRLLATRSGWPYVDNDDLVRRVAGTTAREVLARHGEDRMRTAEAEALRLGLETPTPSIIGIAAGTILDPAHRERLSRNGIVAWLQADPAVLAERAVGGSHRPWLDGDAEAWMRETGAERNPLYRSIADLTVDTGASSAEEVARDLHRRLAALPACAGAPAE